MSDLKLNVTSDEHGLRLDQFLAQNLPQGSRRLAKRHLDERRIVVNGNWRPGSHTLKEGDEVVIRSVIEKPRARAELALRNARLANQVKVVFEDEYLLVLFKPRGMQSVTHDPDDPLTLADCIAAHCGECENASPDPREAGLVQRLDEHTSGLLLAAKRRETWEKLRKLLFDEKVQKTYLALVEGGFSQSRMEVIVPLRQSKNGKRMEPAHSAITTTQFAAKTKITRLAILELGGKLVSLVRCSVARARRHQVRVHLASAGYPIVGDELYGAKLKIADLKIGSAERGFLLLAESLELQHPHTRKKLRFSAKEELFEKLKEKRRPARSLQRSP